MSEKMVEQGGGDRPVWLEFAGVELRVTMPDESVWAVPAHIIADSYANYYTAADGDEYDDLYRFVMEQTDVLTDWASGDMNWSDVKAQARMVDGPDPVDYEEGWANGNEADALFLLNAALQLLGIPVIEFPKAQVEALKDLRLPELRRKEAA